MKTIITLLLLATTITFASSTNQISKMKPVQIEKFEPAQENSILVPTDFAGHMIIDQSALEKLKGNTIYHVELVYTAYRQSPDFNQQALNERRIEKLKKLVPQVRTDKPAWTLVEQQGAKTVESARDYYHGFVIHYGTGLDHQSLDTFFEEFQTGEKKFTIREGESREIKYSSGTKIHVPENAVTYADGTPVKGDYKIVYQEYRDQADIAFSGIPMVYSEGSGDYNFSSVGMYNLTAEQDGKELKLQKPITVDFNCTDQKEGVGFYKMDKKGEWKKVKQITEEKKEVDEVAEVEIFLAEDENNGQAINFIAVDNAEAEEWFVSTGFVIHNTQGWWLANTEEHGLPTSLTVSGNHKTKGKIPKESMNMKLSYSSDSILIDMDERFWSHYTAAEKRSGKKLSSLILEKDQKKSEILIDLNDLVSVLNLILNGKNDKDKTLEYITYDEKAKVNKFDRFGWNGGEGNIEARDRKGQFKKNDKSATLLAEGIDAGHTYPNMVKGLNSKEFGVYNCDQIYRIGNSIALQPSYVDENGNKIKDTHVACVIDMKYNGAFSFHPNNLNLNAEGENVILLFTKKKEVYLLSKEDFASLDTSDRKVQMKMTNVTGQIKNSNDLRDYLSL